MNINFHYLTIKALARMAGLPEGKAQLVAEYSQLIDDYSTKDTISVDWAPQEALDLGLAVSQGGRFTVKLVTTGFVTTPETIALYDETLQNNMLIPFHFILPAPLERGAHYNDPVVPAHMGGPDLISSMLSYLKNHIQTTGRIGNLNDADCIQMGCLLHTFADTYAHHMFSGHWNKATNNYEIDSVFRHRAGAADADVTREFAGYVIPYAWLPTIGHTTVGHAPDDTDVRFVFRHRNSQNVYARDNTVEFMDTAEEIYGYLCSCQGTAPNFALHRGALQQAFLADNYDFVAACAAWAAAVPQGNFHYDKTAILTRMFPAGANESAAQHSEMLGSMLRVEKDEIKEQAPRQVNVTQEFYDFSLSAWDMRAQVTGKLADTACRMENASVKTKNKQWKGMVGKMNWGSLISTVLPTIGTVVGQLLGVKSIEDGVVTYQFSPEAAAGANAETQASFAYEDGDYYLFNQSVNSGNIVTISFPSKANIGPQTIMIPGRTSFKITQLFKDNADMDNSSFELTAGGGAEAPADGKLSDKSSIKISSSGYNIPVGDGAEHSIGAYLSVKVDEGSVTIIPKAVSLQSLPLVAVHGSGDTTVRVMDAGGQSGTQATVAFPEPFIKGDQVNVEVMANVSGLTSDRLMKDQEHSGLLSSISDEQWQRLQGAKRLNWRENR